MKWFYIQHELYEKTKYNNCIVLFGDILFASDGGQPHGALILVDRNEKP